MPSEWPTVLVEDIATRVASGPFGSNLGSSDYIDDGVPVIRGFNLAGPRFVDEGFAFVSPEKADSLGNSTAFPRDIAFAARGTVGSVGFVPHHSYARYVLSPNLIKLTVDATKADPAYVFYYFRSSHGQHEIFSHVSTTGVPKIERALESLRQFKVTLPPIDTQRAIGRILGVLDDKIELNRKMNETLEQMARAIFKSWFVDFEPFRDQGMVDSPLGKIPKGWGVDQLSSQVSEGIGGDWGSETQFDGGIAVRCLRGVDLENLRASGWSDAPVRWVKAASLEKRRLTERDVIVASSGLGPLGRPLWAVQSLSRVYGEPITYSNFCARLTAPNEVLASYVDRVLWNMRVTGDIWEYATGTSIPNLDVAGLLKGVTVVAPPTAILSRFHAIVRTAYDRLLGQESRTLAAIRDALLPKLMSGEVQFSASAMKAGRFS